MRLVGCSASGIGDCKTARLRAFARHVLPEYDIVCLQEMFGAPRILTAGRRALLLRQAKKCGFKYVMKSPFPTLWKGRFLDGGCVILSKFPIEETSKLEYDDAIVQDSLASKGVIHARVKISKKSSLNVFVTHLQAAYHYPASKEEARVQKKQLQQLCKFVKLTMKSNPSPIIVLGDFNIDAFQNEENALYTFMVNSFDQIDATNKIRDLIRESHDGKSPPTTVPYLFNKETGEEYSLGSNIETETGPRLPSPSFIKENLSKLSLRPQALDYAFLFDRGQKLQIRARVQEFRMKDVDKTKTYPFFYLSDHFGLGVDLRFQN